MAKDLKNCKNNALIMPTVKHGGGVATIWACSSAMGLQTSTRLKTCGRLYINA